MFSRKTVCIGLYIDKTCVPEVFSESLLNNNNHLSAPLGSLACENSRETPLGPEAKKDGCFRRLLFFPQLQTRSKQLYDFQSLDRWQCFLAVIKSRKLQHVLQSGYNLVHCMKVKNARKEFLIPYNS